MKRTVSILLPAAIFLFLAPACKKDDDKKERLSITPEKVVSYVGKNWNTMAADLSNKEGYLYTSLDNPDAIAAISLPAIDREAPAVDFNLLFNVDRENRVSVVILKCTDTLDVPKASELFLYYYHGAFEPMANVNYQRASCSTNQNEVIDVDELVDNLHSSSCPQPILNFRNPDMDMSATYFKVTNSDKGLFNVNIFAY